MLPENARIPVIALALSMCLAPVAGAQPAERDIQQQLDDLAKGQQDLRKELAEIKSLLQASARQPAARPDPSAQVKDKIFELGENPVKGAVSAQLTLIEFLDYQ